MNNNESLREGLTGHQIVEFPTIYVCKQASISRFRLMINDSQPTNKEETKLTSSSPAVADNNSSSLLLQSETVDSLLEISTSTINEESEQSFNAQDVNLEISLEHTLVDAVDVSSNFEASAQDKDKVKEINEDEDEDVEENVECDPPVAEEEEEDVDEGYEEFMNNLMDLQGKDIKTLQSIIQTEQN